MNRPGPGLTLFRPGRNRHLPGCDQIHVVDSRLERHRRDTIVEEWMSTLPYRGLIAWAAVLVTLLSSRAVVAQGFVGQGPDRPPGTLWSRLVSGAQFEVVDRAKAERRLRHLQAKLERAAERRDSAAADRDVQRIEDTRFRIAVDVFMVRMLSCQEPGLYP